MTTNRTTLDFRVVEDYIARHHPDNDQLRADCATVHGRSAATDWLAEVLDVRRSRILTWRNRGVRYYEADAIAVRLGRHPAEIFDGWWRLEPDERDRDVRSFLREQRAVAAS